MGLDLKYIDGQTPLDEDEKDGLLIKTISTREELDEFEQLNIEKAVEWTISRKFTSDQLLTELTVLVTKFYQEGGEKVQNEPVAKTVTDRFLQLMVLEEKK